MTCDPCQTEGSPHSFHPLWESLARYPSALTEEEGAQHGPCGDDKAKDAVGTTLDQVDPGAPLEGCVWAHCAC